MSVVTELRSPSKAFANNSPAVAPEFASAVAPGASDVSVILPRGFRLQSGEKLSRPELRVRIHGDPALPAVVAAGGFSAGRNVADNNNAKGWWREIAGPGRAIDITRFCLIGFDFLPNAGETARTITTLDQARALACAIDHLRIKTLHAFVGASYGGMVALAFAAEFRERAERICVISAADRPHPAATALRGIQRRVIDLAVRAGAPAQGVSLARQIAMTTYRTPEEFGERFAHRPGFAAGDPYDVCEYLIARGDAYDMAPARYLTLSDSIDRHCVDVSAIKARSLFIAVASDRLVPAADIAVAAAQVKGARFKKISSLYGHDAFLKEAAIVGPLILNFIGN